MKTKKEELNLTWAEKRMSRSVQKFSSKKSLNSFNNHVESNTSFAPEIYTREERTNEKVHASQTPIIYKCNFLEKLKAKCKEKLIENVRAKLIFETENEIWPDKFSEQNLILPKATKNLAKMAPTLTEKLLNYTSNCEDVPLEKIGTEFVSELPR